MHLWDGVGMPYIYLQQRTSSVCPDMEDLPNTAKLLGKLLHPSTIKWCSTPVSVCGDFRLPTSALVTRGYTGSSC